MSAYIIERVLYSSETVGTGEPVHFMKYGEFRISEDSGFDCTQTYGNTKRNIVDG